MASVTSSEASGSGEKRSTFDGPSSLTTSLYGSSGKKCPFCKYRGKVELMSRSVVGRRRGIEIRLKRKRVRRGGGFSTEAVREEIPVQYLTIKRTFSCQNCSRSWSQTTRKTITARDL
ncbi:MAG TPA: hypothetical protein VFF30_10230 [Nitrososphaerales archaeon]|nr:hypothetical protein [Nitrososphaerales archaeon]